MRRKGEKRLVKTCGPDTLRSIERMIATGDDWFQAWLTQMSTPYPTIARQTGIAIERIMAIGQGDRPSDTEMASLAALWATTPDVVTAMMPPADRDRTDSATV